MSSVSPPPPGGGGGGGAGGHAHGRPDLRIGAAGGALVGNNVYGSAIHQTVEQGGAVSERLYWHISVQNDARVSDRIKLKGTESARGFTVQYFSAAGVDVTDQVVKGKFRTPRLAAGSAYRLKVVVTVTADAEDELSGTVKGSSRLSPARKDVVGFVAKRS